jgi:hypothetical protein
MWAWSLTNGRSFPFNNWFVFEVLEVLGAITLLQSFMVPESVSKPCDDYDDETDGLDDGFTQMH